jgi:hypothetical protein
VVSPSIVWILRFIQLLWPLAAAVTGITMGAVAVAVVDVVDDTEADGAFVVLAADGGATAGTLVELELTGAGVATVWVVVVTVVGDVVVTVGETVTCSCSTGIILYTDRPDI